MSSYDNFIGNFMGLPEHERKKFVEFVQKLSGVSCNDESATNNVDGHDLPSGTGESPVIPLSVPEQVESDLKKSPMKQNTLDKWLLKSKATASKDVEDINDNFSNQLNEPSSNDNSVSTSNKLDNVTEITDVIKESTSKSDHYRVKQSKSNRYPVVVLEKIHIGTTVMESLLTEPENSSEVSNSSSLQNSLVTECTKVGPISADGADNLPMQANKSGQFEEQASTLNDLSLPREYSLKLRGRSNNPQKPSTESIHPLSKVSKVNKDLSSLHLERSKISVLSNKPMKSLRTFVKNLSTENKSTKTSSASLENLSHTQDDWDEIIESVVKNVNSLPDNKFPESDPKKIVPQGNVKESPKMKIESRARKGSKFKSNMSPGQNLTEGKTHASTIGSSQAGKSVTQGYALQQVPCIQTEGVDRDSVSTSEKFTSDSISVLNPSSSLKESATEVSRSGIKEKQISSAKTKNVAGRKSLEEKDVLKSRNDPPRRSKRTLFPKESTEDLLLDKEPSSTLKNSTEVPVQISNLETDILENLPSVIVNSRKPCSKKQASSKTKTSASHQNHKRSLDSDEVSTSEKLEPGIKICSSSDQQSSNLKSASPKAVDEDPTISHSFDTALNAASSHTSKIKKNNLSEKSRSSQRKTTPKKIICSRNKNQVVHPQIFDNNLVIETNTREDVSNILNLNKSNKADSFKENKSTSKGSNTEELFSDGKNQISLQKKNVSSKELSSISKKVVKKGKKTKNVQLLDKNPKNIKITVSSGSEKKISFTENTLASGELNTNESNRLKRKSFLKFAVTNPESQDSNSFDAGNKSNSLPSDFDTGLSVDSPCASDPLPKINKKGKRGSKLTLYSDLKNVVVTIQASTPDSEDSGSVPPTTRSKRKISIKPDSSNKLCLETVNQEVSHATKLNKLKKQSNEDSNLITSKKGKSNVHQSIPIKKTQKKRIRLNSIGENLSAVPIESESCFAQNCLQTVNHETSDAKILNEVEKQSYEDSSLISSKKDKVHQPIPIKKKPKRLNSIEENLIPVSFQPQSCLAQNCLETVNQEVSDATNLNELEKQSNEDSSLISSKKENSKVHQSIPIKKTQKKRKRLNSIEENLIPVSFQPQNCLAQNCLETVNQEVSDATNLNELEKQSNEDSSLISSKKENSKVHQSIPIKKTQKKRKRLNSIDENLSAVPIESENCLAQNYLETVNQEASDATNLNKLEKQSCDDSNLISSKKENSKIHQSIPINKIQNKRKRLNSIVENLIPVPLQSQDCLAQNCMASEKNHTEVINTQSEEPDAISTPLNSILDCSIGMPNTLGLSQKQLTYEAYDEVNRLCSSIGLNSDELFQIPEIIYSIRSASSEDVFIIRGHKLPSDVIVPSVCKTDNFRGILTNSEISKIV